MTNITRRRDTGLGKTAAGGNAGSFSSHHRSAAAPPAPPAEGAGRKIVGRRTASTSRADIEAASERLAERYPQIAEALEAPDGSFPKSAANSAARWLANGEPEESAMQLFNHDRMHNSYMDHGAPAPKRRKCAKCYLAIEPGTGRKVYWPPQNKTGAMCDSCADGYEFRPERPEATVDNSNPIYAKG